MDKPKLLDQVRTLCRVQHKSIRTERAYVKWIREYILFHGTRHPSEMGRFEIEAFLSHLAVARHVAASTQNQAFSALIFLYREVLQTPVEGINATRAKRPENMPTVFSREEVTALIRSLQPPYSLLARLYYGSGLRLMEGLRLRAKDLDLPRRQLTVRDGKGAKDRVVSIVESAVPLLEHQLHYAKALHSQDLAEGFGAVYLPTALDVKYPNAATSWEWQYVFPAGKRSLDPRSGVERRHHVTESAVQKRIKGALNRVFAGRLDTKRASVHTLRHSCATHLLEAGWNIEQVRDFLGHKDIAVTKKYLHCMQGPVNPLDI